MTPPPDRPTPGDAARGTFARRFAARPWQPVAVAGHMAPLVVRGALALVLLVAVAVAVPWTLDLVVPAVRTATSGGGSDGAAAAATTATGGTTTAGSPTVTVTVTAGTTSPKRSTRRPTTTTTTAPTVEAVTSEAVTTTRATATDPMPSGLEFPVCTSQTFAAAWTGGSSYTVTMVEQVCVRRTAAHAYDAWLKLRESKLSDDDQVTAEYTLELRRCSDDRLVTSTADETVGGTTLTADTSSVRKMRVYAVVEVRDTVFTASNGAGGTSQFVGTGTTLTAKGTCA